MLFYRYVERNVEDYRKHCLIGYHCMGNLSYLVNKPVTVVEHLLTQIKNIEYARYAIDQVQPGVFIVQGEGDSDNAYSVSFGDATSLPSCGCIDWLKYKLPCVHMVAIFHNVPGWSMEMLSPLYVGNPAFTIDFSCFDRVKEDVLLSASLQTGNRMDSLGLSNYDMIPKASVVSNLSAIDTFVSASSSIDTAADADANSEKCLKSLFSFKDTEIERKETKLTNLATDCNQVCKELSSAIHQVDNRNMLQKVKLDLQFMLNDVKQELSKAVPNIKNGKKRSFSFSEPISTPVKNRKNNADDDSDPTLNKDTRSSPFLQTTTTEVWVFDAELNVSLLKNHREAILKGEIIDIAIMHTVQKVLQHQFNDVSGFLNFELLQNLCRNQSVRNDKKILQIHRTEDNHWAASARIDNNVCIYCCTLTSKAKIIQQVLKMVNQTGLGENILFIERSESDDIDAIQSCGLYAIAYCVAFAFDIEARSLLFEENGMRSHLVECLEDMCFSMFPPRT